MEVLDPLEKSLLGSSAMACGSGKALMLFPQICLMELQLLASGSPDLDVLGHILESLLEAVNMHHSNAAMIYQQVTLTFFQNYTT